MAPQAPKPVPCARPLPSATAQPPLKLLQSSQILSTHLQKLDKTPLLTVSRIWVWGLMRPEACWYDLLKEEIQMMALQGGLGMIWAWKVWEREDLQLGWGGWWSWGCGIGISGQMPSSLWCVLVLHSQVSSGSAAEPLSVGGWVAPVCLVGPSLIFYRWKGPKSQSKGPCVIFCQTHVYPFNSSTGKKLNWIHSFFYTRTQPCIHPQCKLKQVFNQLSHWYNNHLQ